MASKDPKKRPAPCSRAPPSVSRATRGRSASGVLGGARSVFFRVRWRRCLLTMAHSQSPIFQSSRGTKSATTHPYRRSVKWDLDSSTDGKIVTKAASASGAVRGSDFRRRNFDNWHETRLGVQSQTCFPRPRSEQPVLPFSAMNPSEIARKKCLPKSRLSRLIIRDNLGAQRVSELEVRTSDKSKKKVSHLHDHLKKKFITNQERKLGHWRQEALGVQQYLDSLRVDKVQLQTRKKDQPP
ncbi:uncharacterized protein C5orf52 homolog [Perognathus longimembris pacificus]|uniref:uncharacterized protein C5orf52 homolog n=1 Tax=Perognathus longimembris pacificus TaxID=214514 RepID=UPI0020190F73|nr:uncharacterized protein C5orf52 homolog [Perognathus longimembris pacificus]